MPQRVKVLVVDSDPQTFDQIQQILNPNEYEFLSAKESSEALKLISAQKPDLIMLDLVMPNLSGYDLLVGIKQQHYTGPIIVTTESEEKAIKAFRLGAKDFLTKPLRLPEALAAIERALEEVKLQREKAQLMARLQSANLSLEGKVKELTLLANIGQMLTGIRNIDELFEVVLSSMIDMTDADYAAIMFYDPASKQFTLNAGKNLNLVMQDQLGETIKDEVAELVLLSQDPSVMSGDALQRYKLPRDIRAVVYVSMISHGKGIGVLSVGNYKKRAEFDQDHARLLRALADYAAIGITNARLFSALDARARNSESALKTKDDERQQILMSLKTNIYQPLVEVDRQMTQLQQATLPPNLKQSAETMQEQTRRILFAIQEMAQPPRPSKGIYRITPK